MARLASSAMARQMIDLVGQDSEGQDPPSAHARQADDWKACGGQVHECLLRCVSRLGMGDASKAVWDDLSSVWTAAEDAVNSAHHSTVQRKWRRVYTDACMLKAVAALVGAHDSDSMRQPILLDAIRGLDMAIVVCGAPGHKRLETIHGGIASLQSQLPPLARPASVALPREYVGEASPDEPFCLASGTIKEMNTLPSFSEYLQVCHSEPFIVRSHGADWPALQDGKRVWADVGYLEQVAGPGRVVPVEIGWQYTDSDWHQAIIPWAEFLQESGWSGSSSPEEQRSKDNRPPTYLAQHNLFSQFPALEADFVVPDIVYSCPPAPAYHDQYRPPRDDEGLETTIINAWFGPAGTLTPVHFDPYYNAYVQVVGSKAVWISPPDALATLPLLDGNTSTLAVFDPASATEESCAGIRDKARKAILGPGDLLVLPPGWYHAMRSLSRSASVSMWF